VRLLHKVPRKLRARFAGSLVPTRRVALVSGSLSGAQVLRLVVLRHRCLVESVIVAPVDLDGDMRERQFGWNQ